MPSELERLALIAAARQEKARQEANTGANAAPELAQVMGQEDGILFVNRGGSIRPATNYSRAGLGVGDVLPQTEGLGLETISPEPFEPEFPIIPMVQNRKRFIQNSIIPFVYGVPFIFEYAYAPGASPEEFGSASQWLYTRNLERVPINHIDFIEIKYAGATDLPVEEPPEPEPICTSYVTLMGQHYPYRVGSDGSTPSWVYKLITVTECEPPPEFNYIKKVDLLHNATFIEHKLKIGPFDAFLTYTESVSHSNGLGNRTSASFQTTEEDENLGLITADVHVVHPNTLLDTEDQNPQISARRIRAGNSMPYSWTLSSSVDSISGSGIKEVGAAWPVVAPQVVEDDELFQFLTEEEIEEFLADGFTPLVQRDVLEPGGREYASTNSVQIPIQRSNRTPYISSASSIDFVSGNQSQSIMPALGGITALPPGHDFYQQYLSLPYRSQGLADWVVQNSGALDDDGNMLFYPLKMPLGILNRLKARGAHANIATIAHGFCHLTQSPPTLLFPVGPQTYLHQVWAQNFVDPANPFWELRDPTPSDNAEELDWRYPMQQATPPNFDNPCHEDLYENRFANIVGSQVYEVAPADLAAIFANASAGAVSIPFTGKSIVVDENDACMIGAAKNYAKSFPPIPPTQGVTPLAAAPNRTGGEI